MSGADMSGAMRLAPAQEQDSAPDKEAIRISDDIKFLEKKFKVRLC